MREKKQKFDKHKISAITWRLGYGGYMETRPNGKILFVEDEENLLNSISFILEAEGFVVHRTRSGEEALSTIANLTPDLILLDITLPGIDGFEVAEQLRKNKATEKVAIVMLTGRAVEDDVVRALETWADDYIVKPVRPRMLIARLNAVLRRKTARAPEADTLRYDTLSIDIAGREASIAGTPLALTRTEFDILLLLAREPNTVFSRTQVIGEIRGEDYFVTERSIDFQIFGLRKKLGPHAERIETIRGIGYKFRAS